MRDYREYPARFVEQTALTSQHLRQGRFLDRMKDRVRLVFIGIVTAAICGVLIYAVFSI